MNMQRQIWLLAAIRGLRMFMITMPVIVLYWQSHGLLVRDIFILQVIFSIAVVVFEIPSGYFSDRFGHRTSLICGSILGTLGFFTYWIWPSYLGFVVAEIALALSTGFLSGARQALLHDTLKRHGQEANFTKFEGRQSTIGFVSEAVAGVSAGVIVVYSTIETVLLIQWLVMALTIPLSFALLEARERTREKTPALLTIIRGNFKENERLRYFNLFTGALMAGTLTATWFMQPHWKTIGVEVLYFGYLWAGLNLIVALGSLVAHRLEQWLRLRPLFGVIAIALPLGYFEMSVLAESLYALLVLPMFFLLRGIAQPIIAHYVQRECKDEERATVSSINALASRLIFSIFSPFLGWIADIWDFQVAFAASAVVFGSLCIVAFLFLYAAMGRRPA